MKNFIKNHPQPFITITLVFIALLAYGVYELTQNTGFGGGSEAARLRARGDRFYASWNLEAAADYYRLALDADPMIEELYPRLVEIYAELDNGDAVIAVIEKGTDAFGDNRFSQLLLIVNELNYTVRSGADFFIRGLINKPEGDIMRSDLDTITQLNFNLNFQAFGAELIHFRNLEKLTIQINNAGIDFKAMPLLSNLRELYLNCISHSGDSVVDLTPLSELARLNYIEISCSGSRRVCRDTLWVELPDGFSRSVRGGFERS